MHFLGKSTVSRCAPTTRRLRLEPLEDRRMLAVFTVDNVNDSGAGSLRQAIEDANAAAGADVIEFQEDLSGTILLSSGELAITDELMIDGPGAGLITIDASGSDPTPGEANGDGSRIFKIDDGDFNHFLEVEIRGLTLTGGDVTGSGGAILSTENLWISSSAIYGNAATRDGGGIHSPGGQLIVTESSISGNSAVEGGGIYSIVGVTDIQRSTVLDNLSEVRGGGILSRFGQLLIANSAISGNSSGTQGGGIYTSGETVIAQSSVTGNFAASDGGGIYAYSTPGNMSTIAESTIAANAATGAGGGIAARGDITIANSTISGNTADNGGGGIYASATSTVIQSTISGNTADGEGGGILASQATTLSHSTITDNESTTGGGLFLRSETANMNHTIVAQNQTTSMFGSDLTGLIGATFSATYSLIGDNRHSGLAEAPLGSPDAAGNLIGDVNGNGTIDPILGPLGDNGGVTPTRALLPGSPAIDAGDPSLASAPTNDQRGSPFVRAFDGDGDMTVVVDIGAYERQDLESPQVLVVDTLGDERDGDFSTGDFSLREAVGLANGNVGIAEVITFDSSLDGGTIVLGLGELLIDDSLTIDASALSGGLTIDASGNDPTPAAIQGDGSRVLHVDDGDESNVQAVELRGLVLTGGDESGDGGAILSRENVTVVESSVMSNAAANGAAIRSAGGIGAGLTVTDSTMSGNSATSSGGAIDAETDVKIARSTFSGNSAFLGGAINLDGYATSTITETTVSGNSATVAGGGMAVRGNVTISNSAILGNSAAASGFRGRASGGGLTISGLAGDISIVDTTISGNSATASGIDGRATGGGVFSRHGVTILRSTVSGNTATSSGEDGFAYGGGISTVFSFTVTGSTIANNSVTAIEIDGNATGGGIFSRDHVTIESSTISGNSATDSGRFTLGGGISAEGSVRVNQSTISENAVAAVGEDGLSVGGGIFARDDVTIENSIVAGNFADRDPNVDLDASGLLTVRHSLFGGFPMLGPLQDNGGPTFTHALLPGSPAIDAGDNTGAPPTDQRGFVRVVDGGSGQKIIDMGAYEFAATLAGDGNGDGHVGDEDYTVWANNFGLSGDDIPGDYNNDGVVGPQDYTVWANNFGAGTPPDEMATAASRGATGSASASAVSAANLEQNHRPVEPALRVANQRPVEPALRTATLRRDKPGGSLAAAHDAALQELMIETFGRHDPVSRSSIDHIWALLNAGLFENDRADMLFDVSKRGR